MSRKEQFNTNPFLSLQDLSIFYDFKYDPIKDYLNHTHGLIQVVEQDVKEKIQKWDQEKDSDPEIPDGFDIYEHEVISTGEFRSLLNNSMFLTIYSLFENEFVTLCEYAGRIQGSLLHPKELSGQNYIDQCRRFIVKELEVNLDSLNSEWEEITKFQTLRNSLAHNNGVLKDKSDKYLESIKNINGLSVDEKTLKIKIKNDEFLISLIDKLVKFLNSIIEKIIEQKVYK